VGGAPLRLHVHQATAIAHAAVGRSYVVTTGTGSGKSLCFFIPLVDAILRERQRNPGAARRTQAIVIYPMNALANSQEEEIKKFLANTGDTPPVTVARYTGQESDDQRRGVAETPPDILLTNFMMLELLLTRQDELDLRVIGNCAGLRFLVLDELHTYRGRQGADVAMLVRRVRERLGADQLQCIGTSATMVSEGREQDRARVVATVASRLFATTVTPDAIVTETLERATDPEATLDTLRGSAALAAAIDVPVPDDITDKALASHPLAIWVELVLGIVWTDHKWVRAKPLTMTQAVERLAADSSRPPEACRTALQRLLLIASMSEAQRTDRPDAAPRGFFPFKLHQFIAGAGHAYATLDPPGKRSLVLEGQQYLPGDETRRLYATHFCRECGQDYHPVRLVDRDGVKRAMARDIEDTLVREVDGDGDSEADEPEQEIGFLAMAPGDPEFVFADRDEDYPEAWLEPDASGLLRLRREHRFHRAIAMRVEPDGRLGTGGEAWFIPGKFRFCLRCGETHGAQGKDMNRLASLSAEGRSSATTVIVATTLRWMHGPAADLGPFQRKLLGFTDNRQDAALQAGHFNDFIFVSLLRAGFWGAARAAGAQGLAPDQLGTAMVDALGLERDPAMRAEWLANTELRGVALIEAQRTLRDMLTHRAWIDQRRGWRFTNPNLEQLDLLAVEYPGLVDLAADAQSFADAPDLLRYATPAVREAVLRRLFDYMRQGLAIDTPSLDPAAIDGLRERALASLRTPWAFGRDERPRGRRYMLLSAPPQSTLRAADADILLRAGNNSLLGRALRESRLWAGDPRVRELKRKPYLDLLGALLKAASDYGYVRKTATPFGEEDGWLLVPTGLRFVARAAAEGAESGRRNRFFVELYTGLADALGGQARSIFGFEAREHTAQVRQDVRQIREQRFRHGEKEQETLVARRDELRDLGESGRFLPVMFCSPTMELGVDISALNAVYLRNTPPTPANYAQRSGRAGRSGQAALVVTYCAAQSPHDQYFFRDPRAMVHGEVRAPMLDLSNQDLVVSHLNAIWLAATGQKLESSISAVLATNENGQPVRADIRAALREPRVTQEASQRMRAMLRSMDDELTPEKAPWFEGVEATADAVAAGAADGFDHAFARWRDLMAAAASQRDAARRVMDDHSLSKPERDGAKVRHAQAIQQIELLLAGRATHSSDFYTYRYLATEGFLPGYNFPRLPLMAFIPGDDARGKQTYLQRPRFLALSEFGPRSLVYHEGRAYRVERVNIAIREGGAAGADLPTTHMKICRSCGAGHVDDADSTCRSCGASLGDAELVKNLYRIENVSTRLAERITANDEERQRQGFELQTTYRWAIRDGQRDLREARAVDATGEVLRLRYGAAATITRINKGLRRRASKNVFGFRIDPLSGHWAKNDDEDAGTGSGLPGGGAIRPRQRIVPFVEDRKNTLHVQPTDLPLDDAVIATLQYAISRGIDAVFQLEEGEILSEPMPLRDARKGFLLYEATEGGAGVLGRLVAEPGLLARVAHTALSIMHFDVPEEGPLPADATGLVDEKDTTCVAGCYRCLLSYFNQPDHELIDRRLEPVKQALLRLAAGSVEPTTAAASPAGAGGLAGEGGDVNLAAWHQRARALGLPPADARPLDLGGTILPLAWRGHYVAALIGPADATLAAAAEAAGLNLILFPAAPSSWDRAFQHLRAALTGTPPEEGTDDAR
jgi:superfamily II DNA/RNA helicase